MVQEMKYDFSEVKREFMQIQDGIGWNAIREKYPYFRFSDMDHEMKSHMNELIKKTATQEQIDNPHIHYEIKKSTSR